MLLPLMVDHVPVDQFYAVLMKCTTNIVYPQVHWHLKFLALVRTATVMKISLVMAYATELSMHGSETAG